MSLSPKFPQFSTLIFPNLSNKLISPKLFSSINTQIQQPSSQFDQLINPNPNPNSSNCDFDVNTIEAVDDVKHDPFPSQLLEILKRYVSSPKQAFPLYKWAEKRRGYRQVRVACEFVDRRMSLDPKWVPSLHVYNVLLYGSFRSRNVEKLEGILSLMRRENVVPGVVTYRVLVGGYCQMSKIDEAVELIGEMRRYGVRPSRIEYDLLVDALARAGRLKEALGMLERFMVLEDGPTLTTYNALVRGFCVAGDIDGAGKMLKMMSSRGIVPDISTFNNFFRYFRMEGKVEEGMRLYRKVIENGYEPNEKTFSLMLSMLWKADRLDLAVMIRDDMRARKVVLNSFMSKVLVRLFCKTFRFKEAVMELEELIQSGFIPILGDCQTLQEELSNNGLHEMAEKVSNMVNPYVTAAKDSYERSSSIIHLAKDVSVILEQKKGVKRRIKSRKMVDELDELDELEE